MQGSRRLSLDSIWGLKGYHLFPEEALFNPQVGA
jgi:hypothetical protein